MAKKKKKKIKAGASSGKTASKPVSVIFDTDVLRSLRVDEPGAEFRVLQRLAEDGKVVLRAPEMVIREWVSHLAESSFQALDELESAATTAARRPSLAGQQAVEDLLKASASIKNNQTGIRQQIRRWYQEKINDLGISGISLRPKDTDAVLDSYGMGDPPFRSRRARDDFPDGFVLAGVKRENEESGNVVFVSRDKRLGSAAASMGITVAQSLADLLKLPQLQLLHTNLAFYTWWMSNLSTVVDQIRQNWSSLQNDVNNAVDNEIVNAHITHDDIPEDNREAWVSSAYDASFYVDWDEAKSLGEGVVEIPMRFDVEVELEFSVFRSDAFDVPDWVSVTIGDFEEDHYFDAYGSRIAQYYGRLVIEFDESVADNGIDLSQVHVSVEDVEFRDFNDGVVS